MNRKFLTLLVASKVFLVSLVVLFLSEFLSSNISLLAWILQLLAGSLAIIHVSAIAKRLAARGERENG